MADVRSPVGDLRLQGALDKGQPPVPDATVITRGLLQPSDADLMRRIADGDREAFSHLFDRYAPTAMALARRILRGSSLAEEAVQEAFLAVWREPVRYLSTRASVRTWLLSIVHHRAVDLVRREQSQLRRGAHLASEGSCSNGGADPFEETLVQELGLAEQGRVVRTALNGLPPAQHQIITLMYFDGLSQTQISERLSIPLGTVKSRSLLGMRRLRSTLVGMER